MIYNINFEIHRHGMDSFCRSGTCLFSRGYKHDTSELSDSWVMSVLVMLKLQGQQSTFVFYCSSYSNAVIVLLQQGYSIRTFTGHSAAVMSLDFHPNKDDLICSCDGDNEIRFWSINNGNIVRIFKVTQFFLFSILSIWKCCFIVNNPNISLTKHSNVYL